MSEEHDARAADEMPPDEDNSVLAAVDGRPDVKADPDPDAFAPGVEVADEEAAP